MSTFNERCPTDITLRARGPENEQDIHGHSSLFQFWSGFLFALIVEFAANTENAVEIRPVIPVDLDARLLRIVLNMCYGSVLVPPVSSLEEAVDLYVVADFLVLQSQDVILRILQHIRSLPLQENLRGIARSFTILSLHLHPQHDVMIHIISTIEERAAEILTVTPLDEISFEFINLMLSLNGANVLDLELAFLFRRWYGQTTITDRQRQMLLTNLRMERFSIEDRHRNRWLRQFLVSLFDPETLLLSIPHPFRRLRVTSSFVIPSCYEVHLGVASQVSIALPSFLQTSYTFRPQTDINLDAIHFVAIPVASHVFPNSTFEDLTFDAHFGQSTGRTYHLPVQRITVDGQPSPGRTVLDRSYSMRANIEYDISIRPRYQVEFNESFWSLPIMLGVDFSSATEDIQTIPEGDPTFNIVCRAINN